MPTATHYIAKTMQGQDKHVHFAADDEHYMYPSTPSPTYSESSLPSSPGVMTPPLVPATPFSVPATPFPYQPRPLPPVSPQVANLYTSHPSSITIHPALDRQTAVRFDLRIDPLQTRIHPELTPAVLTQPATHPSLPQLVLKCRFLPWQVVIQISSPKPDACVTVADVISGTYTQLCQAVKAQEFDRIPSIDDRNRIRGAWQERCHLVRGARDVERRVDFLMENVQFRGLSTTTEAPHILRLSVSPQ